MSNNENIFRGLKLYKWQKDVCTTIAQDGPRAGKVYVVKARRQCGKSIMLEQILLYHAINHKGSVSICLSLTMVHCRKIYKELVSGCINSGIIARHNDSLLEVEFITGSTIMFKSIEQKDRLRGYTVRSGGILVIDEAAYINDEIYDIISPWTDVNNANTLMVSTPRFKTGKFYDYFIMGAAHLNPMITSFDWCSSRYDMSKMLNEEKLELYRKTMPEVQFKTEYLGEFAEEGGCVFNMQCITWKPYRGVSNQGYGVENNDDYKELYLGIDWGTAKGEDYTVLVGFDENKEQRLYYYQNTAKDSQAQIQQVVDYILKMDTKKIKKILVEENSIGTVYKDLLSAALRPYNLTVDTFTTTNESKREIIEDMCKWTGAGEVKLFNSEFQKTQFSLYGVEITKSGKITYNATIGHDDVVMADAIALHGWKQVKTKSNYIISTGSKLNKNKNLRSKYD